MLPMMMILFVVLFATAYYYLMLMNGLETVDQFTTAYLGQSIKQTVTRYHKQAEQLLESATASVLGPKQEL
jgi:hypothetical protein